MKPGTPQFVGERLREAREARARTAVQLADRVHVSPQAISGYERGKQTPAPAVLRKLAEELGVPTHFFLRPIRPEEPAVLFFRSLSAATKRDRLRAGRQYEWLRDVVGYLHDIVEFPAVRFPNLVHTSDPRELRVIDIENAAAALRREWGLRDGPISNIAWLAENHGAVIARQRLNSEALDAFSQWNPSDATPYIVVGTEKESAVRGRFNMAHEIGHLILHRHVPASAFNSPPIFKMIELQANRFASAFLMPPATFARSLHSITLDAFRAMKEQWQVSIGAMIVRAGQLHLVNEDQVSRLFINRNRRGWTTSEPLDDVIPTEEPRFLRKAFDLIRDGGVVSWEQMELHLARWASDIEAATGLPGGYLAQQREPMRLRIGATGGAANDVTSEPTGNWMLFPRQDKRQME